MSWKPESKGYLVWLAVVPRNTAGNCMSGGLYVEGFSSFQNDGLSVKGAQVIRRVYSNGIKFGKENQFLRYLIVRKKGRQILRLSI